MTQNTSRRAFFQRAGFHMVTGGFVLPLLRSDLAAQQATKGALDYVCPMHPNVRSDKPGSCSQCGMQLKLGVANMDEFGLELTTPAIIEPGRNTHLKFVFKDPKTGALVKNFEIMHEKLFHLFIVSSDLKYFVHDHPAPQQDGSFLFDHVFPTAGMYRLVADVYPSAGAPQLIPRTLFVTSPSASATLPAIPALQPDFGAQHGANTTVALRTIPEKPTAGARTLLFFDFNTSDGMEKYLGAWAHMLAASDDTIDMMHEHPVVADGGSQMQFAFIFPRAHTYRVWLQFQRSGVVNTVAFNVPAVTLENAEGVSAGF